MSNIPSTIIQLSETASEKDICSRLRQSARQLQGQHQEISIEYASSIITPSTIASLLILKETTHLPIRLSQSSHRLKKLLHQLNLMEHFEGIRESDQTSERISHEQVQTTLSESDLVRHQFWT